MAHLLYISRFILYRKKMRSICFPRLVVRGVPKKLASLGTQRKKISEVVTINADDAEPALYVINYETGGFVILSADNRVEPILAYSESNYFESENVTYPEGLVEWMDEQKAYVSSVRTGKGEQSPQVKKLWDNPNIIIKQGG
jgi:hypothetical protein